MSYTLYGHRRSGSLIVELALAEIGVDYAIEEVSLEAHTQRSDTFAAINPQRKLPALITPAGETLTETVAILLTLDERHAGSGLLPPPGTAHRAQVLRQLLFIATEIYPLVEINDYPARFSPNPEDAAGIREIARQRWRERWLIVEAQIEAEPYASSYGFSALDIYIAVVSRWAQQETWRIANLTKVERVTLAVAQRACCAPVWDRHRPDDPPTRLV